MNPARLYGQVHDLLTHPPPPTAKRTSSHGCTKFYTRSSEKKKNRRKDNVKPSRKWILLGMTRSELSLPLTLPTGQTFRWKLTGAGEYSGVVGRRVVSLRHTDGGDVACCFDPTVEDEEEEARARVCVMDFLNSRISLKEMWEGFSAVDSRFFDLGGRLGGARVLRQDPVECLFQFLCSSNNNIKRITGMVDYISSLGRYLGSVGGFKFYEFPSLDRLALVSEDDLKSAGFGYRAKYITGTVKSLMAKPGGGVEWLDSLRSMDVKEAVDALTTLPGVGPKVASCVALFSLDQHDAIPVDTHVWQMATRYLLPELAGVALTKKHHGQVAAAFVAKYGKYAGWAQTLLFVSDLPSQKTLFSQLTGEEEHNPLHPVA